MSRGPWFTPAFKTEVWRRWQAGENCADIARALGTYSGPLHRLLRQRGGVAHLRYRSARSLSLSEREEISRGICAGDSIRAMARRMGRAPSSISREIAFARARGFARVQLETASVLKEAIALYRKAGFTPRPGKVGTCRCDQAFVLELG